MSKKPNFRNVNVLLADSDACLAQAVIHNLRALGFVNITHVKSTEEAVRTIRTQAISFLITEWDMKGSNGVELVRYLRRSPESPNRGLPIIMLTGRGELNDVQTARDVGITEFVVKPFSAQTLFCRIEQIVDNPRGFVVSDEYVGPERRRRGLPPPGMTDRRVVKPVSAPSSRDGVHAPAGRAPVIFAPDVSLRVAIGANAPLGSLITPQILQEAQKAIDDLGEVSMQWIRDDLALMQSSYATLKSAYSAFAVDSIKESALSIKARSGTFGYRMASDVARLLYLFLSTNFVPTNPRHLTVIEKHIQVLLVIFAQKIKEREGLGAELYTELEHLISVNK
ncbi:MAG: response regulator [Rickettsiales bacterium]|nr:response regulator [Rickettsiales bacterium]